MSKNVNIVSGIKRKVFDPSRERYNTKNSNNNINKNNKKNHAERDDFASKEMALHILSTGYCNNIKTCVLVANEECYLINAGEGTQRLYNHENLRLRRLKHILMTRVDWAAMGGLCSISMDLSDPRQSVILHSPMDLKIHTNNRLIRPFIEMNCKNFTQHIYSNKKIFEDNNVKISLIDFKTSSEATLNTNSYQIVIKKIAPRFLPEKMYEYDLKPGLWVKKIIRGIPHTLPNGQVLNPNDFLDHSLCVEKKILVIDIPDKNHINLLDSTINKNDEEIKIIVHMSDSNILNSSEYINWIKSFKTNCIHAYMDEEVPSLELENVYTLQAQLNSVNQNLFPLLHGQTKQFNKSKELFDIREENMRKEMKLMFAKNNMVFNLNPDLKLNIDKVVNPDNRLYMDKSFDYYKNNKLIEADGGLDKETSNNLDILRKNIDEIILKESKDNGLKGVEESNSYPKVLFLGTSSSIATSVRNVTSIFLKLNPTTNMMFDCGEFNLSQLFKKFGKKQTDEELVKLKCLFLTHIHSDHHSGVFGLILARIEAFERLELPYEKLILMVPKFYIEQSLYGIDSILKKDIFDYVKILPNEMFMIRSNYYLPKLFPKKVFLKDTKYLIDEFTVQDQVQEAEKLKKILNLNSIKTISVHHVSFSYGIIIEINRSDGQAPFKLVFSGDCRPNDCLAIEGSKCDLLIHECTFDNERYQDAINKNHSTTHEAITISRKMEAKNTILTHLSARYGILGHIDEIKIPNIAFSFDFMYIDPKNLAEINSISSMLATIFSRNLSKNTTKKQKVTNSNNWDKKKITL